MGLVSGGGGSFVKIADVTLSAGASSIGASFSSGAKSLYCILTGTCTGAQYSSIDVVLNADVSAGAYAFENLDANLSTVSSTSNLSNTAVRIGVWSGNASTGTQFATFFVNDVDTTLFKHITGTATNVLADFIRFGTGQWRSTTSVTSISCISTAGNLLTGTRLRVYRIV